MKPFLRSAKCIFRTLSNYFLNGSHQSAHMTPRRWRLRGVGEKGALHLLADPHYFVLHTTHYHGQWKGKFRLLENISHNAYGSVFFRIRYPFRLRQCASWVQQIRRSNLPESAWDVLVRLARSLCVCITFRFIQIDLEFLPLEKYHRSN